MPKLVNIDEARIIRCKQFKLSFSLYPLFFYSLLCIVLADPSAPSMTSPTVTTDMGDSRNNSLHMAHSPVTHENTYPPSPSTSTGYNYNSLPMSARSAPEQQIPVSPKLAQSQPQQYQQQQQQPKPSTPKQQHSQPIPKPSVITQQCKLYNIF
jgi:hypothetical protein